MVQSKTSLSVGEMIRSILIDEEAVISRTNKIIPVDTLTAELPYIVYRRCALEPKPHKGGNPSADTVQVEVTCFAAKYAESVELAEAVRACLDGIVAEDCAMKLTGCYLSDAEEWFENDAFIQKLVFTVKI